MFSRFGAFNLTFVRLGSPRAFHASSIVELYEYRDSQDGMLTKAQLDELIESESKEYRLIDVREVEEYAHGVIPTAEKIPLGRIPSVFTPGSGDGSDPPSEDSPDIICYCRSGMTYFLVFVILFYCSLFFLLFETLQIRKEERTNRKARKQSHTLTMHLQILFLSLSLSLLFLSSLFFDC